MNDATRAAVRRLDLTTLLGAGSRLLARFGVIGVLAFVVDVGSFNLLRHGTGLDPFTAKTIAVVVATTFAFVGNLRWTFDERPQERPVVAYALFFLFNGIGLLISLACLFVSSSLLGLTSPLAENVSTNGVGLVLGTAFRFYAYQRWVFPRREQEHEEPVLVRT